jgi:quercetin dioxygenase-like cupin family protein
MRAFHYNSVPAETTEDLPGVSIRWALGKNVGAPNYVARVIELQASASTAYHTHPWEHEVVVMDGEGAVRDARGDVAIGPGSCVYVEPNEEHQFINTGQGVLRFVCVIPYPPEG